MNFSNKVPDMKGKKKETVGKASEAGRTMSTYSTEELITLTHCWREVYEDLIVANNREGGFWGHITKRYEQVKPEDPIVANNREGSFWGRITKIYEQVKPAPTHQLDDLRKH